MGRSQPKAKVVLPAVLDLATTADSGPPEAKHRPVSKRTSPDCCKPWGANSIFQLIQTIAAKMEADYDYESGHKKPQEFLGYALAQPGCE